MKYLPLKSKRNYRLPYGCRRNGDICYAPEGWWMTVGASPYSIGKLRMVFLIEQPVHATAYFGVRLVRSSDQ